MTLQGPISDPKPFGVQRIKNAIRNAADVQPVMAVSQLVRGWLSEEGLSVLYGPSNVGKTFVALSMAAHVAAGQHWWGCRVRQVSVLYLALEGGVGFDNRVAAIKNALPELSKSRRLFFVSVSLDLFNRQGLQDLCDALPPEDWGLIIVDTLARAMSGADENTAQDMGKLVGNLDRLREVTGAHVMVVHHSGKDKSAGARGSSALRAAVDTELALSAEGQLTAQKQRDMRPADPLYFKLSDVLFGKNADGDEVTSAVAVQTTGPVAKAKQVTGQADKALQALQESERRHGKSMKGQGFSPSQKFVHLDQWRDMCELMELSNADNTKSSKQKAFARAKERLLEAGLVHIQDDYVLRVPDED